MTLAKLLFEPTLVRSPLRVVQWWEKRRLMFNVVVGLTGLGTLAYTGALVALTQDAPLRLPWQVVVAYGLAANVCYTMGWVVENAAERWLKRPLYGLGPALFRHGLVFSIGLTLFPAAIITFAVIAGRIFGP